MTNTKTNLLAALVVCVGVYACEPIAAAGISVAPRPGTSAESVKGPAFATAELVARMYQMTEETNAEHVTQQGWQECFNRGPVQVCGKSTDSAIQFLIRDFPHRHLTPWADSLRRELFDSLRARFDTQFVRPCEWNVRTRACSLTARMSR